MNENQQKIINYNDNIRIIAGAGCGKTYTLILKISDLINNKNISPSDILVISFTNNSVNDIKMKISSEINVFTFHKLAIHILNKCKFNYQLITNNYLDYIIYEYLHTISSKEKNYILKFVKYPKSYSSFLKSKEFDSFKNLIIKYINLLKANGIAIIKNKISSYTTSEKNILFIILNIYKTYIIEKISTNSLDLDDLIIYATKHVKKINFSYKYIIIDEFQDTSFIRFQLILALIKNTKAKIIVVGDDWQSIYRFTGCDLQLFLDLPNFISNIKTFKLEENYRNSNKILQISKIFIEKNKYQIAKKLYSNIFIDKPIKLVEYNNPALVLNELLDVFITNNLNATILIRNSIDIYSYLNPEIKINNNSIVYKKIFFPFMTIHKSKGLEFENVILLNCNNDIMGFPNKIEDNSIIRKLQINDEIKYAEERRLFYVALTRTKNVIYLLYNSHNPSIFIKEIKKIIKKFS